MTCHSSCKISGVFFLFVLLLTPAPHFLSGQQAPSGPRMTLGGQTTDSFGLGHKRALAGPKVLQPVSKPKAVRGRPRVMAIKLSCILLSN